MGLYLDLHPHLYLMLPRPLPLPPLPLALLLLALFQHHTPSATDISSACCWRSFYDVYIKHCGSFRPPIFIMGTNNIIDYEYLYL